MVSCTRFFFMYKFLAPNTAQLYSIQETCMHVTRMVGCLSLPLFSFCCVCVVDNVLYKVNMVCLLIYFLSYLSYSSKNSVPMEWSTKSIEKVICFVQERPFLFDVSSAELAWTCTKISCKILAQETCTSFLRTFLDCVSPPLHHGLCQSRRCSRTCRGLLTRKQRGLEKPELVWRFSRVLVTSVPDFNDLMKMTRIPHKHGLFGGSVTVNFQLNFRITVFPSLVHISLHE